jgi:hypothetical protein
MAYRYLVRGPRIFALLHRLELVRREVRGDPLVGFRRAALLPEFAPVRDARGRADPAAAEKPRGATPRSATRRDAQGRCPRSQARNALP